MNVTVQSNAGELASQLTAYLGRAGEGRRVSLREVGRRLVFRLLRFTPPPGRPVGERAVRRDLQRALGLLRPGGFRDPRVRRAVAVGDHIALTAIFSRYKRGRYAGARVVPFEKSWHERARDWRGRVRRRQGVYTADREAWTQYRDMLLRRVGYAKGGWAASALALGEDVLPWVERHRGVGSFREGRSPLSPGLEMISRTGWAVSERQRVEEEVLRRVLGDLARTVERRDSEILRRALAEPRTAAVREVV